MYRARMIDRNQMLVAASLTASRHQIGIAGCRPIQAGTVLMCMIPRSGWSRIGSKVIEERMTGVAITEAATVASYAMQYS